jgi:hypothetical protein
MSSKPVIYIDHTTRGLLAGLEETGEFGGIGNAQISIKGEEVDINVDNRTIPTNAFVSKLVKGTLIGMVSSLKGVATINTFIINIKRG